VARAQQGGRMRRIGVLLGVAADDPESPMRLAAFLQGLQELGWTVGRNVQIDIRWAGANDAMIRKLPSGEYRLYSRKTNPKTGRRRNLGTFSTLTAAKQHEREVQFFKKRG
jgi:hypothetical protein